MCLAFFRAGFTQFFTVLMDLLMIGSISNMTMAPVWHPDFEMVLFLQYLNWEEGFICFYER